MVKEANGSADIQTYDNPAFDDADTEKTAVDEVNNESSPISAPDANGHDVIAQADEEKHVLEESKLEREEYEEDNCQVIIWKNVNQFADRCMDYCRPYKSHIINAVYLVMILLYSAYLIYACIYDFDEAFVILLLTSIGVFCTFYALIRDTKGDVIYAKFLGPVWEKLMHWVEVFKWFLVFLAVVGLGIILYFLTRNNPIQLVSFAGLITFIVLLYVFSKYPDQVKWRPVIWGLILQFAFGLLILRTYPGYVLFQWIGDVVQAFLSFASAGSEFLYGENYAEHNFAFAVLPIVIYFSSAIAILYYLGVMQVVIIKIAWLMQRTMTTSASESLNAAGNIFIGQTEAPLLIKPFLKDMTRSEVHAVMTGGFATIAGSVLGAYVLSGISASHLVSASVMSAPAALAVAKLFYPETEESPTKNSDNIVIEKGEERNLIEAASGGASTAIPLVLNIAANLIAFLSLLALVNALLSYFGGLVGYPDLTFELICSYVFMPIAFMMGVEWADCRLVAELIGIKTFVNEFVAYDRLAEFIDNRETGEGPTISLRSEVIATYALCGFANIGSMGIQLGGLTPLAPSKRADMASVALRALIAGTAACFMTACVAGVLYIPEEFPVANATTSIPFTTVY